MKYLYSPQPTESITLEVEWSPVWEMILGIAGYTYENLRHTFDMDKAWESYLVSMSPILVERLKEIQETNLWFGLIMLQNEHPASSVQEFSNLLYEIEVDDFYEMLLPYKDRETEAKRKQTSKHHDKKEMFETYASCFETHEYLGGYVRSLGHYSYRDICVLFTTTLQEWENWISQHPDWKQWLQALTYESKRHRSVDLTKPIEAIERITGGVQYYPEPSIWTVKLIPHASYRPWVLENRTANTKLFFYPLNEDYLIEPGVPPTALVRSHKALGDELRLRLLYQLVKGPLSLQELSVQFSISKTTLHHQLSILKAAKFVRAEKGVYSLNPTQIHSFSAGLPKYLGLHE
ncbi:ArsR/SmtB family transcription factor [Aureibacillus halotolerans]|uniref:ArsR family transcriptional regulator n=1 Tax=Aureibacillus halotolerans TaxID=1508390 RepID=A0A4R6U3N3_9BACI|nr:metalloregulator ArsR/SmtB family transcription factor [Aureibacillus halotolerans]TDQ41088.1 ArsR family transcriptional regulator [Aureibacillus halotolerans]